ncbi:MAG: cation diffusion facilitator family transporter [Sphaerochaeta sp.]|nr:cation diffusion facilitator family transporter [Sphaerochaeta sp.]
MNEKHLTLRVSQLNIIINALLALSKIAIGLLSHSAALFNDGINNAGDVVSSVIATIGIAAGSKASDAEHQYGHERLECVAAILLSGIIMVVGIGLFGDGLLSIVKGSYHNRPQPGLWALVLAIISIIIKQVMVLYSRWAAKRSGSVALLASAWDSQSDVFATTGGLIGIAFARVGYPIADSVAAIIIALFIFRVGLAVFRDGVDKMVDRACEDAMVEQIRALITAQEGVMRLDLLRTRTFANRCYVDVEIAADGTLSLTDAHTIAEHIHDTIEETFPAVKHCMVHVNPFRDKKL